MGQNGMNDANVPFLSFVWCLVTAGRVRLQYKRGIYPVAAFEIAKYPVTNAQYRAFIDAGGYDDPRWWTYSTTAARHWAKIDKTPLALRVDEDDAPRVGVSWYEAIAFCKWLSSLSDIPIRLPMETEWQRAAQGDDGRSYPWGDTFDAARCNLQASGIGRPTPVTQYDFPPDDPRSGLSPFGVADMVGNVWEWCANLERAPMQVDANTNAARIRRGGAWGSWQSSMMVMDRSTFTPLGRYDYIGFRCARDLAAAHT